MSEHEKPTAIIHRSHSVDVWVRNPVETFARLQREIKENDGTIAGTRGGGTFSVNTRWGTVNGSYMLSLADENVYTITLTRVPWFISYARALDRIREYFQDEAKGGIK